VRVAGLLLAERSAAVSVQQTEHADEKRWRCAQHQLLRENHCENVSIVGALIRGIEGSVRGIELVNSKFVSLAGNRFLDSAKMGFGLTIAKALL
jgi:hypothetical protein